jgi:protein phosphatase
MVCSDGLTAMLSDQRIADLLVGDLPAGAGGEVPLEARVDALVDAANEAGGRDNITVLLFRVASDETGETGPFSAVGSPAFEQTTETHPGPDATRPTEQATAVMPAVTRADLDREAGEPTGARSLIEPAGPRQPRPGQKKRRRGLRAGPFIVLFLIACVLIGGYFASQTVYFIGTNRGLVTVYRGLPYELPFGLRLYSSNYPSSVPVDEVPASLRRKLLDHQTRSLEDANGLVSALERGEVVTP